ncbi:MULTISPECIES: hypothetical protein [Flavobacterium]|uniref:EF-hand domain-containing protein n=1 Tax=Flavobacterium columnare TaxID=996 RepID=A0AA94F3T9_9FLAO|nr:MULTISPECIES: hypothetical protein [Flavobacterium]MCH4828596.1 hypothetical protein [Flavobacterium columnare]MCH4831849.1 hypothetical protein [Flavobacterium columnare]MCJ1806844.1 hypothetical protein [Flavobacterium covae]MCJ1809231.1 hypothetical protein [Flavobacterium covae]OWP85800.1 hypothetical protein BWK60_12200 [Flavobacterium covae]
MRKFLFIYLTCLFLTPEHAQNSEVNETSPENFSLEGALAIFKTSSSLEEFEKAINEENNNVNNLDLNDDGTIDYITVEDLIEGSDHVIILSALVGNSDKQDIATLNIEKVGDEEAYIQIIGNEDLFDKNTVVEPYNVSEKIIDDKGPSILDLVPTRITVNVWSWPCIRFIYAPGYHIWVSPVRWSIYPRWWKPWRPMNHSVFITHIHKHRFHFHRTRSHIIKPHRGYLSRKKARASFIKPRRAEHHNIREKRHRR